MLKNYCISLELESNCINYNNTNENLFKEKNYEKNWKKHNFMAVRVGDDNKHGNAGGGMYKGD